MRTLRLGTTIALGLVAGAAIAWKAQPSRADRMLALFRDVCLPMTNAAAFAPPPGLVRTVLSLHDIVWIDAEAGLFLTGGMRSCVVQDRADPIPDAQVARLEAALQRLIAARLPQLQMDDSNELGWDRFVFWHSGQSAGDPARWVISFSRVPASQGQATMLSLNLPRTGLAARAGASGGDI